MLPGVDRSAWPRYATFAEQAAVEAGALLAKRVGRPQRVATKRSAIDLVTELDRASEQLIRRRLAAATPSFGFLGEERGETAGELPARWIVDPLDGTMNFVHGLPLFGVSIGLEIRGTMAAGVIYDPLRRELFSAVRGRGAWLNGRRIRVSPARRLARSLLATGFSSKALRHPERALGWFYTVSRHSHGVRRIGSTVWCLSAVAAGRLEGFYENDLKPWDIAAGMVLVEEAGGRLTDLRGGTARVTGGELVATNGSIHQPLLRVLNHSLT